MGSSEENAALLLPRELACCARAAHEDAWVRGEGAQLQTVSEPVTAARRQIPMEKASLVLLRETLRHKQRGEAALSGARHAAGKGAVFTSGPPKLVGAGPSLQSCS